MFRQNSNILLVEFLLVLLLSSLLFVSCQEVYVISSFRSPNSSEATNFPEDFPDAARIKNSATKTVIIENSFISAFDLQKFPSNLLKLEIRFCTIGAFSIYSGIYVSPDASFLILNNTIGGMRWAWMEQNPHNVGLSGSLVLSYNTFSGIFYSPIVYDRKYMTLFSSTYGGLLTVEAMIELSMNSPNETSAGEPILKKCASLEFTHNKIVKKVNESLHPFWNETSGLRLGLRGEYLKSSGTAPSSYNLCRILVDDNDFDFDELNQFGTVMTRAMFGSWHAGINPAKALQAAIISSMQNLSRLEHFSISRNSVLIRSSNCSSGIIIRTKYFGWGDDHEDSKKLTNGTSYNLQSPEEEEKELSNFINNNNNKPAMNVVVDENNVTILNPRLLFPHIWHDQVFGILFASSEQADAGACLRQKGDQASTSDASTSAKNSPCFWRVGNINLLSFSRNTIFINYTFFSRNWNSTYYVSFNQRLSWIRGIALLFNGAFYPYLKVGRIRTLTMSHNHRHRSVS